MKRIVTDALIAIGIILLFFGSLLTGNIHIMLGMVMVLLIFSIVLRIQTIREFIEIQSNREEHDIFRFFKRKKKRAEEGNRKDPE